MQRVYLVPALAWLCVVLLIASVLLRTWVAFDVARNDVAAAVFFVGNWTRAFSLGAPMSLGNV